MLLFFSKNAEDYKKNAMDLAKVEAVYFPSITLLIGISTLLTIMIGGLYYINGTHQIGIETIVEFVMYINMLTFPVSAIGLTASMIQRAAASQKRVNEFLQIEPALKTSPKAQTAVLSNSILFDHVSYTYPGTGIEAIKNFNLHIKKGERIAIVGRTGSGKSTIANLLLSMYTATKGKIQVDGHDLKEINITKWRSSISYVPQDVFLFSETVENNISFGLQQNDTEMSKKAAKIAVVSTEIEKFPAQYQTMVGERGVTLSGGQKQRISIARALAKNSSLVIFDDCLSAVDARTEKEIIENLNIYLGEKTAIIITHRIFSLLNFSNIIVMEDGEIKEQGTHSELLNMGGTYAEMYSLQQKGR
jgi:ATP-binding cassette, subfamily B, multidrug efflux pump